MMTETVVGIVVQKKPGGRSQKSEEKWVVCAF